MVDEALWEELESEQLEVPGLVRRRVHEDSDRNLFVGVTVPSGLRALVLSVDSGAAEDLSDLPETRALRTTIEPSEEEGLVDVRIVLVAPEMARVFTPFVDDVIEAVAGCPSDRDAVAALLSRFTYWRNLLSGTSGAGLGKSAQQGLFGELWCLRHVVLPELRQNYAIRAWTGPNHDDRDFQFGSVGIEVKTTVLDNPPTVEIASERQLEAQGLVRLFLLALLLDALPAGTGSTLNELIDELLGMLSENSAQFAFHDKLIQYGYLDLHRPDYESTHYSVRQYSRFEVTKGFPRITESLIPEGIGRVRYRLSLNACNDWRIDDEKLASAIRSAEARQ